MATRSSLGLLLDSILALTRGAGYAASRELQVTPAGGYSGHSKYSVSQNSPVVTNPWSVGAYVRDPDSGGWNFSLPEPSVYLKPGQSYNFATGQYNDPSIHNKTAARLNQQVNQMKVNEVGLSQAFQESARQGKSVLATVDELYWGDVRTSAKAGSELGTMQQAKQGGYNTEGGKTILGKKAAAPAPAPAASLW